MMIQHSSKQRTFKNTFAPHVKNTELTAHEIIMGLRTTVIHSEDLLSEIKDAVEEELKRQSSK